MAVAGDAERLQAILELERAIERKRPAVDSAQFRRDEKKSVATERGGSVGAIYREITAIDQEVHRRSAAVYLNGDSLDRGTLTLGNEALHFRGWHGDAHIALKNVSEMDLGQSLLPPRAGIPVLTHLWPGQPRVSDTLLITVRGEPAVMQVVFGGLVDAARWREEIETHRGRLADVAARRGGHLESYQTAQASHAEAMAELRTSQQQLDEVEQEMKLLRTERDKLVTQQHQIDAARARAVKAEVTAANSTKGRRQ